jgi:hypothetical protein
VSCHGRRWRSFLSIANLPSRLTTSRLTEGKYGGGATSLE